MNNRQSILLHTKEQSLSKGGDALVVDNPGQQIIGWVSEYGERLHFDSSGKGSCLGSSEAYGLKDGKLHKLSS